MRLSFNYYACLWGVQCNVHMPPVRACSCHACCTACTTPLVLLLLGTCTCMRGQRACRDTYAMQRLPRGEPELWHTCSGSLVRRRKGEEDSGWW